MLTPCVRPVASWAMSEPSRLASCIHGRASAYLFGRQRRKVDGAADHALAQEVANVHGGLSADQLLSFNGRGGDVRRRHHLRELGQAPVDRRLRFEHVETGAADVSALDRVGERRLRRSVRRARC